MKRGFFSRRSLLLAMLACFLLLSVATPLVLSAKASSEDAGDVEKCKDDKSGGSCHGGGSSDEDDEDDDSGDGGKQGIDESHVVVLDDKNFDSVVTKSPFLLVKFYAPWCGHCQSMKGDYAQAAKELAESDPPVVLGKLDVTRHEALGGKYNVEGFPTLKWFVDGKVQEGDMQERSSKGIVRWCRKKSGIAVPIIGKPALDALVSDEKFSAVFFFQGKEPKGKEFEAFKQASMEDMTNPYFAVNDANAAKEYKVKKFPSIVFFRSFGDVKRIDYKQGWDKESIAKAIKVEVSQTVIEFTESSAKEVFGNDLPKVFLFGPDRDPKASKEFEQLALQYKGDYIFTTVGAGTDPQLWSYVGATDLATEPELIIYDAKKSAKYKLEGAFSLTAGKAFIQSFIKGDIKQFLKTQEVKNGWDKELVKEVVGSQVLGLVKNKERHTVLMIYAPWCGHCQKFAPKYDKAANFFDTKHSGEVTFMKMDGTENEFEGFAVNGFPTILLYTKDKDEPSDISSFAQELKDFVKEIRRATGLKSVKRDGQEEYEAAAERFKQAVKNSKSSLRPAADALNEAAKKVEEAIETK